MVEKRGYVMLPVHEIKKMPDQKTLEAFLDGFHGSPKVSFNIEKGEFEWITPQEDPRLGEPKTEEGWRIKGL